MAATGRLITKEELAKHNTNEDTWVLVNKKVYDVTYFSEHPGGKQILTRNSGIADATEEFDAAQHSDEAIDQMKSYYIGDYIGDEGIVEEVKTEEGKVPNRVITGNELSKHCTDGDIWMLISGRVFDVSKFEHPGGKDILLTHAGRDATQEFEDIGHSANARVIMNKYYIGDFKYPDGVGNPWDKLKNSNDTTKLGSTSIFNSGTLLMIGFIIIIVAVFLQFFS